MSDCGSDRFGIRWQGVKTVEEFIVREQSRRGINWAVLALAAAIVAVFADLKSFPQYLFALPAAALAMLPPVARRLNPLFERLRHPGRRMRYLIALGLLVTSLCYFLTVALASDRYPFPSLHDEFMYLLQARMLASGHLWMPPHPVGEFFDSFFVITKPVYAAAYFPGTALAYVPGIWLGQHPWITSLLISATSIAALYLLVSRVADGIAGMLAAILALALDQLRIISVMTMSHGLMLLLFLLASLAFLRWREKPTLGRALFLGVLCGWAAITRPLDALVMLLPLLIWLLILLRHGGRREAAWTLAALIVGVLPFLSLQLSFDKAVTGSWLKTPVGLYAERNFPGLKMGLHGGELPESPADLLQVRDYHRGFLSDFIRKHAQRGFGRIWIQDRLGQAMEEALPGRLLLVIFPVGLLCIRRFPLTVFVLMLAIAMTLAQWPATPLQRAVIAMAGLIAMVLGGRRVLPAESRTLCGLAIAWLSGALIFTVAYSFWPPYLKHYGLLVAPVFILAVVVAGEIVRRRVPNSAVAYFVAVTVLTVGWLPVFSGRTEYQAPLPYLKHANAVLANLEQTPALVLFKYSSNLNLHEEPVYNLSTAWPDDALVIRAQDRGPDNQRIFDYYARVQPTRFIYLYDLTKGGITPLGRACDLAKNK